MATRQRIELDHCLEAHFATLYSWPLGTALKRSAANWQFFSAVTGSAMAMATGAAASVIGSSTPDIAPDHMANILAVKRNPASSQNVPMATVRLALAGQDPRAGPFRGAVAKAASASQPQGGAPSISNGGAFPLYSSVDTIQPGEWVSIYGSNLASGTATWNGDFPTSLGGTSVEINGKLAYLMYVSPGQINLQAPDDTATGSVSVVVTTAAGNATSMVTLSQFAPSFILIDTQADFISGIILRSDHSGAFGGGTYDILGPTGNFFGYPTVAAREGDTVEIFGVGFGPTTPKVPAGAPYSGAAALQSPLTLYINNIVVEPTFVGLSSAGLYQINLTVPPGLGIGEVPIRAMVGGMQTQANVWFSLNAYPNGYGGGGGTVGSAGGTFGFNSGGGGFGSGGGSGGSGGGSGGGGGSARRGKKPWEPKLRFPPK